ncbi:unnamed protein product [Pleuronectes platessa]|uniref:Uncharacterized protein n=1 Tax=Pleuronectes platessa TaxID=8262 RepID=A0A9N7YWE4_PLEPL|nr:unnamed protein product [Pleuronectes platessa]
MEEGNPPQVSAPPYPGPPMNYGGMTVFMDKSELTSVTRQTSEVNVSAPSRSLELGSRVILARCLAGNQPSGPLREEGGGDVSLLEMRPLYFSDIQQEQHSHHL